jgi:c(7)-type cytochrome triheme protein
MTPSAIRCAARAPPQRVHYGYMRTLTTLFIMMLVVLGLSLSAQDKKAPDKLTFKAKQGNVVFDHAKHVKAANNKCETCHPKLWPQSATAPLNYKAGIHKPAEAGHTSCGFCHHAGGGSFESKGNCNKCHQKAVKG